MNAELVSVGTEILLGCILNTNAQYLSKELAIAGIDVYFQTSVGDNEQRLKRVIVTALKRSDIVILTGGLGPTVDDITKSAVCDIIDRPLVLHEPSLNRIEEYYKRIGKTLPQNTDIQAMMPQGSEIFPNDCGTAPGCAIKSEEKCIILLPGPPKEVEMMYSRYVVPFLHRIYSGSGVLCSKNIHIFGLSELQAETYCSDLMNMSNPTIAPYAKDGECYLRVTAKADTEDAAEKLLEPLVKEIISRLDGNVYGVNVKGIQQTVVEQLLKHNMTIATAESCTAGLLSKRITDISGSSKVFSMGITAYANNIKVDLLGVSQSLIEKHGAVSPQVAFAMARGAVKRSHSNIGIAITGLAGPDGATADKPIGLVYIALHDGTNCWVRRLYLSNGTLENTRDNIRNLATMHALNLVRQYLAALPEMLKGANAIITFGSADPLNKTEEKEQPAQDIHKQHTSDTIEFSEKNLNEINTKIAKPNRKQFDIKLDEQPVATPNIVWQEPKGKTQLNSGNLSEKMDYRTYESPLKSRALYSNCLTPEEIMGKSAADKLKQDNEDIFSDIPLNKFKKNKQI